MRKECLDVFYGKNNFLLDLRGWMDCSYPEKWTPLMIFERWIDAIGNEIAGRLRSLNFMGHSFSVHIRVSKQAPQLASKFHTMPSYEDWIEVAPPGYTFELAACRAEQGLRTTLDNIATERAGKPLRVDDINKVGRFVTMLRPFLCTRCDHLNGAYLKSDRMEEFRVSKLHIEMCGICAYTETAVKSDILEHLLSGHFLSLAPAWRDHR